MSENELRLRYGCNPHQTPARLYCRTAALPITVINGSPGYINLLDALNSWQLVKELRAATGLPAAASFKHVSPAGAAVAVPLSETLKKIYFVDDLELSAVATAYARARGADRMSSYGDWAALSDRVDGVTANLLKRETTDGVIAPGYDPEAIEILKSKKGGKYNIVAIDSAFVPDATEMRDVFGVTFEQRRNDVEINGAMLDTIVTKKKELPSEARRDLIVSLITLKYTQSNSVCFVLDGQVIGVGAGQQSRVHCTRLAAAKADRWFLRSHPAVLGLMFRPEIRRADRDNAIDQFLEDALSPAEEKYWRESFAKVPRRLSRDEKREWVGGLRGVSLGSDAFFPFRDSIDRASQSGVEFVVQPGHSLRDDIVIDACNEYGMAMAFSGVRLFHH